MATICVIALTILVIIFSVWCGKLRKENKHLKAFGKMAWSQMNAKADAVQKKQAELASAQKKIKRLERDLAKRR